MRSQRAVALLLVGAVAGGCSAPAHTAAPPAPAEEGVPAHWRTETYRGVQVAVPKYWDYGVTDHQYCVRRGPGRKGRPYVGRPGSHNLMGCGWNGDPADDPRYSAGRGGTFVWFDAGQPEQIDSGDRETVRVAGIPIVVQAPLGLRSKILATVQRAAEDENGCSTTKAFGRAPDWRPAPGVPVTKLTGVEQVSACQYTVTAGEGALVSSVRLRDEKAAEAIEAVQEAPVGSGPRALRSCHPATTYEGSTFDLAIRSDQGTSRVVMRYETCDHRGFDDGHTIRALTRRAVAPFITPPNTVGATSEELAHVFWFSPSGPR